jgi:hypothetical protein
MENVASFLLQGERFPMPTPIQSTEQWTSSDIEELQMAMINSALVDIRDKRKSEQMRREAYEWLMSDDSEWPLSYVNCCQSIGLDAVVLRELFLRLIQGGLK